MRTKGKVGLQWDKTRALWKKLNPPNHQGYYVCHICNRWVAADEMELDHVRARTRRVDLRFDLSNLLPAHHDCNSQKGSKDIVKPLDDEKLIHNLEDVW